MNSSVIGCGEQFGIFMVACLWGALFWGWFACVIFQNVFSVTPTQICHCIVIFGSSGLTVFMLINFAPIKGVSIC
jgi:hypothetical protein